MGDKQEYLGGLEEVVLIAVQQLGNNAYGAAIHELLSEVGRRISIGSLYVTLARLENKGFVKSNLGDPTAERGGRAKKFFMLTGAGAVALSEADLMRHQVRLGQARAHGGAAA